MFFPRRGDEKSECVPGKALKNHLPFRIVVSGDMDPASGIPDRSRIGDSWSDPDCVNGKNSGNMGQIKTFSVFFESCPQGIGRGDLSPRPENQEGEKKSG